MAMNGEVARIGQRAVAFFFNVLGRNLPGLSEGNQENYQSELPTPRRNVFASCDLKEDALL
jgi:hypothetical protein